MSINRLQNVEGLWEVPRSTQEGRAIVPDEDLAEWFATEIGLTEIIEREREAEAKAQAEAAAEDFFSMLREFPTVSHE